MLDGRLDARDGANGVRDRLSREDGELGQPGRRNGRLEDDREEDARPCRGVPAPAQAPPPLALLLGYRDRSFGVVLVYGLAGLPDFAELS